MAILLVGIVLAVSACRGSKGLTGEPRYGLVLLRGPITDARKYVEWMADLREDDDVAGVLVRIDSPGGVVGPSQELYRAMVRLAGAKPVAVSMGAVCASGGYYMACPGTRLFANPGTLTGSIGVRMDMTNLMELMESIGVRHTSITSGKFKDSPSPFRNMTAEERTYIESVVLDLHAQFTEDILAVRDLDNATLQQIADGRILTGRQALAVGAIDALGGQEEALEWLEQVTGKGKLPLDEGPKDKRKWYEKLAEATAAFNPLATLPVPRWQAEYR
ncbi:MAG: signal peptide peptidase SppA [Desulfovibrio sp.]|nr:signal peptide peptidase SppA [Desulfovibrio sp.]